MVFVGIGDSYWAARFAEFLWREYSHQWLATCLDRTGKRDNNALLRNVNKPSREDAHTV